MIGRWAAATAAVVVVVIGTLAAGACGGGRTAPPAGQAAPTPAAARNQINPQPRDRVQEGGRLVWPIDQMPSNFNYYQLDGTPLATENVMSALMPATYNPDASGTPIWDRNYLASEATLTTEPQQVVTYEINPKANWDDGTPITWQDFYWQWKAQNGTSQAYQISSANGFEDIASVERGKDDREVIVTFKHKYADWAAVFNPIYPASTNKDPKIFNQGWTERPLLTAGPFKLASIDRTAQTITLVRNEKWWGPPAKLDSIVLPRDPARRADRRAGQRRNRRHGRRAGCEQVPAGAQHRRHRGARGGRPQLPPPDGQRVGTHPARHQGPSGSRDGHRQDGDRTGAPRAAGDRSDAAQQPHLHDEPEGLSGQFRRHREVQPGARAPAARRGRLDARRTRAPQGGQAARNHLCHSRRRDDLAPGVRADPEHARPGGGHHADQHGAEPGLLRQVHHAGPVRLHRLLVDRYAVPISSSKSIYAKPTVNAKGQMEIQQNYARVGSDEIDGLFRQAFEELDPKRRSKSPTA